MLPVSVRIALLSAVALRLLLGSAYAAPHALRPGEREGSLDVHEPVPAYDSNLHARQLTGIIDALTDAGKAGSDAAKAGKGGSSSSKVSKSTKSEAKDQNKGNTTYAVMTPEMDIRELDDSNLETNDTATNADDNAWKAMKLNLPPKHSTTIQP
ncbi:hypothetical protein EV361DRAFT_248824 [Lentinula raphanica]|uniref:Uncharacterized protein n=1 Tax=Lentinula raphanica TaxID=153919 RepID=A0AA38PK23_9AGAR|nr:hypothetical protein F5880DRAFT_1521173 [Lentinula raphanica]KAJ3844339.1 hypothetical protein F5878DRAFT_137414 [Lentinula raphanica]KAJ3976688.1 hypothetical protein EV361DRAFT_248824 [Lentinula raphanica]